MGTGTELEIYYLKDGPYEALVFPQYDIVVLHSPFGTFLITEHAIKRIALPEGAAA